MVLFHSYVNVYQRVYHVLTAHLISQGHFYPMVIFIQVTYLIFQISGKWLEHIRNISQDTDMFQWKKENIMEEFPSCEVLNSWNSDDSVL